MPQTMVLRRLLVAAAGALAALALGAAPATAITPCTAAFAFGETAASASCDVPFAAFTATPDPVSPGQTVTLDASASNASSGPIDTYGWDLDGDGAFDDASGAVVTTSWPDAGRKSVGLRVTAGLDQGETRQDVRVTAAPVAVLAGVPGGIRSGDEVTLDASGSSDADGRIVAYAWDLDGNGEFETTTDGPTTTASWPAPGTRTVSVRVTDDVGATATDSIAVVVANRPPSATIVAGQTPAIVGRAVDFTADGEQDIDGEIVRHRWDEDGDGTFEIDTGTNATRSITFSSGGRHVVGLELTDDDGASTVVTMTIIVTRAPTAALAPTPASVGLGDAVALDASGSADPDGAPIARYEWDLDGRAGFERDTGTEPTTSAVMTSPGPSTLRVRVTDVDGATATATAVVAVESFAPSVTLTATPQPALPGQPVTVAAKATDVDGTVTRFEWDRDGDGSFETDTALVPWTTVTSRQPGALTVRVRVTDDDGNVTTRDGLVEWSTPAPSPPAGEQGQRPAVVDGPGPARGTAATPAGPRAGTALVASLGGSALQRVATVVARGLKLTCTSAADGRCDVTVQVVGADARRLRLGRATKPVTAGAGGVAVRAGSAAQLTVRLSARVRRALSRQPSARLVVRGVARDADGRTAALARVVLIRR